MAITQETKTSDGVNRYAVVSIINSDTAATTVNVGFNPVYVKLVDADAADQYEWYEGMGDNSIKNASSLDTAAKVKVDGKLVTFNASAGTNYIIEAR